MINPFKITNFKRSTEELEEFALFAVLVAGKTAVVQAKALDKFLRHRKNMTPFEFIRSLGANKLINLILECRLGQHTKVFKAFNDLAYDFKDTLTTCNADELQKVHGIGPKTARFFILHSRPQEEYVVFDVHISKYLNKKDIVPFKDTPSPTQYAKYEPIAIKYLKEIEGVTDFARFDLEKWSMGTKTKPTVDPVTELQKERDSVDSEILLLKG